jgi:diaminopimelate decarboxylase
MNLSFKEKIEISSFGSVPIDQLANEFGTPLYVYDEAVIKARIEDLKGIGVIRYAQKALPNLSILKLMRENNIVVDAVSAGEIYRAIKSGYRVELNDPYAIAGIVYTADILDEDAIDLIREHKIPVNVGSANMISQLVELKLDVPIILRINPGFGHGHSNKTNTGGELSKHGIWHEDLPMILSEMEKANIKLYGLHMHIGSGTDMEHLLQVAKSMEKAVSIFVTIFKDYSGFKLISAGGGLPIPYLPGTERVDLTRYKDIWRSTQENIQNILGGQKVSLEIEPGRYLVAESGIIITKVRAIKKMGSFLYYLVNAGFDTFVRPAMYGAYHYISVCPADSSQQPIMNRPISKAIVAGPLCESGDVFTQVDGGIVTTRDLPEANVGDFIVLHDTGAYGSSMASQYNSRLLAPEVLISNGVPKLIRRKQTLEEVVILEEG